MSISSGSGEVYVDFQGLNKIKSAANRKSPEALEQVAEQFEALFLQTMLKTMRATSFGDGLMDNDQSRMYQDMFDQQLALDMAKRRQGGIANAVLRQLRRDAGLDEQAESKAFDPSQVSIDRLRKLSSVPAPAVSQVPASQATEPASTVTTSFASSEDFVKQLMPLATRYARQLGVEPKVLLAQAALETGWGQAVAKDGQDRSSHNLFNIKADERWGGPTVGVSTLEYEQGIAQRQYAQFRAYPDYEASFKDYVAFVQNNPRYQQALMSSGDAEVYLRNLQAAGYATDPAYADKIVAIMKRDDVFTTAQDAGKGGEVL